MRVLASHRVSLSLSLCVVAPVDANRTTASGVVPVKGESASRVRWRWTTCAFGGVSSDEVVETCTRIYTSHETSQHHTHALPQRPCTYSLEHQQLKLPAVVFVAEVLFNQCREHAPLSAALKVARAHRQPL